MDKNCRIVKWIEGEASSKIVLGELGCGSNDNQLKDANDF